MKLVNVGHHYKHPMGFCINRPSGSGDYLLLLLKSDAFFVLNNEKISAPENTIIIFNKETPQIYGALNGEFINDWIHFEMSDEDLTIMRKLKIPFDTILEINETAIFSGFIKSIFHERYAQNIHKDRIINLYFELILLKLSEKINAPEVKNENRYFGELTALRNEIYLKPNKDWNLNAISKNLKLSRSYIQHLYKAYFGSSIVSDITNSRMEYAKFLLSSTDMSISSVSELCGYNHDVHFMRTFKKHVGVTPTKFRT